MIENIVNDEMIKDLVRNTHLFCLENTVISFLV